MEEFTKELLVLPDRLTEFRRAVENNRIILMNSSSFLLGEKILDLLLGEMKVSSLHLMLRKEESFGEFSRRLAESLGEYYGFPPGPEEPLEPYLERLAAWPGRSETDLLLVSITGAGEIGYATELSGLMKRILAGDYPFHVFLTGAVTTDLYLGNYLLLDHIAVFGAESFHLDPQDQSALLEYYGFNPHEIEDASAFCGGDLGCLLTLIQEKRHSSLSDLKNSMKNVLGATLSYFRHQFGREELSFLSHLSVFSRFSLEMLDDFYAGAYDHVPSFRLLREKGMALSDGEGGFRLLPFVRQMLQEERLAGSSKVVRDEFDGRAMEALIRGEEPLEALKLAVTRGHRKTVLDLTVSWGLRWFQESRLEDLEAMLSILGEGYGTEPVVQALELLVNRYKGELKLCQNISANALQPALLLAGKHPEWAAYMVAVSVLCLLDALKIEEAARLLSDFRTGAGTLQDHLEALLRVTESQVLLLQGNATAAEPLYYRNVHYLESYYEHNLWNGFLLLIFGQAPHDYLRDSRQYYRSLEDSARFYRTRGDVQRYLWSRSAAWLVRLSLGEGPGASREIGEFLTYLDNTGETGRTCAWGQLLGAVWHRTQGDLPRARKYLNDAVYHATRRGYRTVTRLALLTLARVYREEGNLPAAEKTLRDLEKNTDFLKSPVNRAVYRLEQALVARARQETVAAREHFREALDLYGSIQYHPGEVVASFEMAMFMLEHGDPDDEILDLFSHSLKLAKSHDCIHVFRQEGRQYRQLVEFASARGVSDPLMDQLEEEGPGTDMRLDIRMFGEFVLRSAQGEILEEEWPTRKVKGLFIYLLLHREERIARERLAEIFWPEVTDPVQASSNLRVALSLLGKNLAGIGLKEILKRNRQKAWLELPRSARVDYYDVFEHYNRGRNYLKKREYEVAEDELKSALEILERPYLETLVREPWMEAELEKVDKQREKTLYLLIRIALASGKLGKAEVYCRKVLEKDRYREDIYVTLITILKKEGRLGEALSVYRYYRKLLKDELKVRPGEKIMRLAGELTGSTL